jgi:hypothetical protein
VPRWPNGAAGARRALRLAWRGIGDPASSAGSWWYLSLPKLRRQGREGVDSNQRHAPPAFGWLTVQRRSGSDDRGKARWACRCDCGNRTVVIGSGLRSGKTISCGCRGSRTGAMNIKHGHTRHYQRSPEYHAWANLVARCYRPTHQAFRWYGGAGTTKSLDPADTARLAART